MIPKIIHYFWESDKPMPENLKRCVESWHQQCPDFEIRCWNVASLGDAVPVWVTEAIVNRKFAFAADFVRYYALYNFGGIYMDTDVELIKPFDKLIEAPYLMCFETEFGYVESGFLAVEKGHRFTKLMLDYYENRHFVKPDGALDMLALPDIFRDVTARNGIEFVGVDRPEDIKVSESQLFVLPSDYFSPISLQTNAMRITDRTVAIHHFESSWKSPWFRFKKKIQRAIGPRLTLAIIRIKDVLLRRKSPSGQ